MPLSGDSIVLLQDLNAHVSNDSLAFYEKIEGEIYLCFLDTEVSRW